MNILIKMLLLFASVLFFNSCSFLMIGPAPSLTSYKYYSKNFKLQANSSLKTTGLYYYKTLDTIGRIYYHYLRFYEDGRVNSMSTQEVPQITNHWDFNDFYGYYRLNGSNIAYELKARYKAYHHGEGKIVNDTLHLKVFIRWRKGSNTHNRKYIFYKKD